MTQPQKAHLKDRFENHLHELLCAKQITLEEARKEITYDWTKTYKKYFGAPQPVVVPSPAPAKSSSSKSGTKHH